MNKKFSIIISTFSKTYFFRFISKKINKFSTQYNFDLMIYENLSQNKYVK